MLAQEDRNRVDGRRHAIPAVSVVIPTHNRRALLAEALESVLAQEDVAFEAIVVADGCQDDTLEWLNSVPDPRLHVVVNARRRERSAARNAGIEACRGAWILFLDDDDLLLPGALATLYGCAEHAAPSIVAVWGRVFGFGASRRTGVPPWPHREWRGDALCDAVYAPYIGSALLRADVIRAIGGWSEEHALAEDYLLSLEVCLRGEVIMLPAVVRGHRRHQQQTDLAQGPDVGELILEDLIRRAPRRPKARLVRRRRTLRGLRALYAEPDRPFLPTARVVMGMLLRDPEILKTPVGRCVLLPMLARAVGGPMLRRLRTRGSWALTRFGRVASPEVSARS